LSRKAQVVQEIVTELREHYMIMQKAATWPPLLFLRLKIYAMCRKFVMSRNAGPKQMVVFTAELGRAFVADLKRCGCGIHAFCQHQAPGFLQAELLLEL